MISKNTVQLLHKVSLFIKDINVSFPELKSKEEKTMPKFQDNFNAVENSPGYTNAHCC